MSLCSRRVRPSAHSSDVSHFVYSSVGSADQHTGIPHFESKWKIEEHLRGTGMPYTILRPVYFMENWLQMKDMIDQGKVSGPQPLRLLYSLTSVALWSSNIPSVHLLGSLTFRPTARTSDQVRRPF